LGKLGLENWENLILKIESPIIISAGEVVAWTGDVVAMT